MKTKIRSGIFETASSSIHSLVLSSMTKERYVDNSNPVLRVKYFTEEEPLYTLQDKVSYLVSHIVNKYTYSCSSYEEILEDIETDFYYNELKDFVKNEFGKEIKLPKQSGVDIWIDDDNVECEYLDEMICIDYQLQESDFVDVLRNLLYYADIDTSDMDETDMLRKVLQHDKMIVFGRD